MAGIYSKTERDEWDTALLLSSLNVLFHVKRDKRINNISSKSLTERELMSECEKKRFNINSYKHGASNAKNNIFWKKFEWSLRTEEKKYVDFRHSLLFLCYILIFWDQMYWFIELNLSLGSDAVCTTSKIITYNYNVCHNIIIHSALS